MRKWGAGCRVWGVGCIFFVWGNFPVSANKSISFQECNSYSWYFSPTAKELIANCLQGFKFIQQALNKPIIVGFSSSTQLTKYPLNRSELTRQTLLSNKVDRRCQIMFF
ncbi:MAG TPA: hypothetical protein DEA79_14520 [Cyanobacteria bacterium UBA11153]|nr:hypothetical protein [Cyanobacteria bacterium UBA11153]